MKIKKMIIKTSMLLFIVGVFFITSFSNMSYAGAVTQDLGNDEKKAIVNPTPQGEHSSGNFGEKAYTTPQGDHSSGNSGEKETTSSEETKEYTLQDVLKQATDFLKLGKDESSSVFTYEYLDGIFNIIFIIGSILTFIVGGVLGIKFMAASAEEKAKIKESMIPYVLGCIVIFGAVVIWKLVVTILNGIA